MCNFFSFLADDKHNFHHFSHAQRLAEVKFTDGKTPIYDSHASIAKFYGIKEDDCNKYEYNPFNDKLTLDYQNMEENKEEVLAFVHSIHWQDFCGDIEGFHKFLDGIKDIKFMQNNPDFDLSGCKIFDTRNAAYNATWNAAFEAACEAAKDIVWNAAFEAACEAARDAAWVAALKSANDAAWVAAGGAAFDAAWDAANDIALYCLTHYLCADLPIAQEHIDHSNKRYSLWLNGYGVLCDVNGILYAYRRNV